MKVLEVPVSLELVLVAVIVELAPDWLSVIALLFNTPAVKAAEVPPPAPIVRLEVTSTVPVKAVTVFPNTSWAVIWVLKLEPAVRLPMFPPPWASTRK